MKSYKLLLINILFLFLGSELRAQCETGFKVQNVGFTESQLGYIELSVDHATVTTSYNVKAYEISDQVNLISEGLISSNGNTIRIDALKPSTYWLKIEWGNCSKTVGGLDGIVVDSKDDRP